MFDRDNIDKVLRRRAVPQEPPGLADRIIASAFAERLRTRERWPAASIRGLLQIFAVPKPAYVCAATVILGLAIGLSAEIGAADAHEDMAAYMLLPEETGPPALPLWEQDNEGFL